MYVLSQERSQIKVLLEETKITMNKNRRKNIISLKRYIMTRFFGDDTLAYKNEKSTRKLSKC